MTTAVSLLLTLTLVLLLGLVLLAAGTRAGRSLARRRER